MERRLDLLLQGMPQNAPKGLLVGGGENPPAQSCDSLHTRKGPSSHRTHRSSYTGTVWVRVPHGPTLNSPQAVPMVSLGLPLHPYSPPCDFKQPGLSWCCSSLVWYGREPLTWLSPRSPGAGPARAGLGLQLPWSLCWSQCLFVLKQFPYHLFFQCPLYFLVSYLHVRWGAVGCSLCSSVDWVGVSPRCRGKWTLLPPISPSSSRIV